MRPLLLLCLLITPAYALEYEDDIMSILMGKCADCHSAEAEKVKGGLKFDDPDHLLNRLQKNSLVIPGDWDASYLFITIFREPGHEDAMPPKDKGEHLDREEVRTVMQWIADGAPIGREKGETGPMPEDADALLAHLKAPGESTTPAEAPEPEVQKWTSLSGSTIEATLVGREGPNVLLKLSTGRVLTVPVNKLTEESLAQIPAM